MINKKQVQQIDYRINAEIEGVTECRVSSEDIPSQVMPFKEALKLAESMEMDLIEINSKVNPPIMRIAPYDKFLYQQKKRAKANKQQTQQLKEIQLRVNIAENDLKTKARKAAEFINDGDKVKVVLTIRGRELARREENKKSIYEFITLLDDVAQAESMPKDEGNRTIVILKPKRGVKSQN